MCRYSLTHLIRYYYSVTWSTSVKGLFNWKEEAEGNFETLIKTFLDRERVVKVLTDFILFTRQDDEFKKVVLRPHQMRAVAKLIERASAIEKKRGLLWHTQGSGKTYTMIVAAQKIIENPIFENPTVIMLVDRNELAKYHLSTDETKMDVRNPQVLFWTLLAYFISWRKRWHSTRRTLRVLSMTSEINAAKKEQTERDMPVEIFSIFWLFKNEGIDKPDKKAEC